MEQWRAVDGWPYEVSDQGRVRRGREPGQGARPGRVLRPWVHSTRCYCISLFRCGAKPVSARVHRLVAAAFIGPEPQGHEVNHINGDRFDNRVENLEYVTSSENKQHAFANGLIPSGEEHPFAKLTNEQVREIRVGGGEAQWVTAERYGISQSQISRIRAGRIYKYVP